MNLLEQIQQELNELKDYTQIDTGSKGKINTEEQIYSNLFFELGCKANQEIIGLCGGYQQLDRHIRNYEYLRCGRRNMVFVEKSPKTYEGLFTYAKSNRYQCKIKYGDIKDVVRKHFQEGKDIYLIDYDSIEDVSQQTLSWIDENIKNKYSQYFLVVVAARSSAATKMFLTELSDKLKLQRVRKQIEKTKEEYTEEDWKKYDEGARSFKIIKDGQIPKIHDILRSYLKKKHKIEPLFCASYQGHANMTLILIKNY